jgi:hypothetical protein
LIWATYNFRSRSEAGFNIRTTVRILIVRHQSAMKFACFHCRKVFNKPMGQISPEVMSRRVAWTPPCYQCDECGEQLHFTGAEFRPPSRQALDQWRKAELLIRSGFLFLKDVGPYPKTLSEARKFVKHQKRSKDVNEALQMAKDRKMPDKSLQATATAPSVLKET